MVSYNQSTEQFTVIVAIGSLVLPVYVKGVEDEVDAKHEAVKAVRNHLASKLDNLDIGGDYPIEVEVLTGLCEMDDCEVEVL